MTTALFLPGTPLLLPGLGGRDDPAGELRDRAIAAAVTILHDHRPRAAVVIGPGPTRDRSGTTLEPAVTVARLTGRARQVTDAPPSDLVVGASVLSAAGWTGPVGAWTVDGDPAAGPAADPELIIVVGDGSALRRSGGPDVPDPRAAETDERVRAALAAGDPAPLAALSPDLASALMITGAPAWRWLAGRVGDARPIADLIYADDPFGVFMIIARWEW